MKLLRATLCLLAILASGLFSVPAHADSWRYPPKVERRVFRYGETQVVLIQDARKNQKYPEHTLEVLNHGKIISRVPGVYFEELFASKDNKLFVGLSNRGIPGVAAVVFTSNGNVTLLASHGIAEFEYCSKSAALERVWFDAKNPNVRFRVSENEPDPGIYLRACNGQEIELVKTIQEAYARAQKSKR